MRIFTCIEDLWGFCEFCPLCKQNSMSIDISVGPDECFEPIKTFKKKDKLYLTCEFYSKTHQTKLDFDINCINNTFEVIFSKPTKLNKLKSELNSNPSCSFFYFYFQSSCEICGKSIIYTDDIEISLTDKKLSNIKIEKEVYFISNYRLALNHISDKITIYDLNTRNSVNINLFNIDFSDLKKLENRVSTILTFS